MSQLAADTAIVDAPGAMPLLGHFVPLIKNPTGLLRSMSNSGEGVLRVRVGPWKGYMVCDPELTHQMLLDDRTFDKGGAVMKNIRDVTGNGIAVCPHADHRKQRRIMQPAFNKSNHARFASVIGSELGDALSVWPEGQLIDIISEMRTVSARSVIKLMISGLTEAELEHTVEDVKVTMAGMFWRTLLPPPFDILPIPGNVRFKKSIKRVRKQFGSIVDTYRKQGGGDDLVSYLVRVSDDDGGSLTDEEISAQVYTVFAAGADSTAHALGFALYLIAKHPDVLRKVQAEVDAILGDRVPTVDDLDALTYTTQVITETLRLYPTSWFLSRVSTAEAKLGNYRIPKGSDLIFSPFVVHHRPETCPDVERFDPDRWAGDPQGMKSRLTLVPFGSGPRKCLAEGLVRLQAVLSLAMMVRRWELRSESDDIRFGLRLPLSPLGLKMRAFKR
ncbi:cytochrome P450 [Amycolatopsis sp. cg5]|uniref:cytochrome P450 n=1 Tax=Amycolatopsis sp. cg5 TaxID=3238802 RepID=UPI0035249789